MPKGGVIVVTASLAGLDRNSRTIRLRAHETRCRRLRPLGRAAARRARHPHPGRVPGLGRHRLSCPRPSRRSSRRADFGSSGRRRRRRRVGGVPERGHRRGVDRAARTRAPAVRVQGRAGAALMLTRAAPVAALLVGDLHSPPRPVGRRRSRRRRTSPPRRRLPPAGFPGRRRRIRWRSRGRPGSPLSRTSSSGSTSTRTSTSS